MLGRGLVEHAQGGHVEAGFHENFRGEFVQDGEQADVDDLGGLFADDVDTDELHVFAPEEQFEEAFRVADDAAARVVFVKRAAHDIFRSFFPERLLRLARHADLRDGVDAGR